MKNIIKPFFSINTISLTFCTTLLVVILFVIGVRFLSRGHLKGSSEVVMAVLDEKSLDEEGRWPWPRSKIAALIDRLSQDGARVIGFDIGFLEADENSYLKFVNQLDQEIHTLNINNRRLDNFIKKSKIEADNDGHSSPWIFLSHK
ncbi:MAG: CHASE2 domain-containing protein [Deltaproteobacteria bacterium]|nr:CHASE2 domain-containing protein [Deltaproteobacteria bacterium]